MFVFPYHAKRFAAMLVGNRVKEVQCEGCGTQYFYQLTRIGFGSSSAPYGLGAEGAKRKAAQNAQVDLARLLANDVEMVPCPKCNWVSDALIRTYRAGRYREMADSALLFAVAGVVGGAFCFLIAISDPRPDFKAATLGFVLFAAVGITIALAIVGVRHVLRSRLQPNAHHSAPPRPPLGTPPAIVRNPENNRLELASRQLPPVETDKNWTVFFIGRHRFPQICSECLRDCSTSVLLPLERGLNLAIPTCDFCKKARKWRSRIRAISASLLVPAIALALLPLFHLELTVFLVVLLGWCAIGAMFGLVVARIANRPARAEVVDAARGVVLLRFRNDGFRQSIIAVHP